MKDIKKLFKRTLITASIFLVLGLVFFNIYTICLSIGCYLSVLSLYLITEDAKTLPYIKDAKTATKMIRKGYIKRYIIYIVALALSAKFIDDKALFLTAIGLFNVRLNIYVLVLQNKIKDKIDKSINIK